MRFEISFFFALNQELILLVKGEGVKEGGRKGRVGGREEKKGRKEGKRKKKCFPRLFAFIYA